MLVWLGALTQRSCSWTDESFRQYDPNLLIWCLTWITKIVKCFAHKLNTTHRWFHVVVSIHRQWRQCLVGTAFGAHTPLATLHTFISNWSITTFWSTVFLGIHKGSSHIASIFQTSHDPRKYYWKSENINNPAEASVTVWSEVANALFQCRE